MKNYKIGLQLYSVRDEMEKDVKATLQKVKDMGYDYVEFAGYFGYSAEDLRAMLDEIGLTAISVHQKVDLYLEKGQEAADYMKTLGVKYSAVPWYDKSKLAGTDGWDNTVKEFATVAKLLSDNGIQMCYHNHEFEFDTFEGKYLLDILYEVFGKGEIDPELDLCWVHYAGLNPAEYLVKYADRMGIIHFKDFVCKNLGGGPVYALVDNDGKPQGGKSREETGFEFRPLGEGLQNFPAILEALEKTNVEYIIVEQDQSYDTPSLEAAAKSRAYLKTLGL